MSVQEKMSRDELKQQYPDIYQEYVAENELSTLKQQAITEFDIIRSTKRGQVRIVGVCYSELQTMFCDECNRRYSENEYMHAVKYNHGWMPCGHDYMDCYNISETKAVEYCVRHAAAGVEAREKVK